MNFADLQKRQMKRKGTDGGCRKQTDCVEELST